MPAINLWSKYTLPAINSIKTKYEYRIMLIDNASTDETITEAGKLVSNTFAHVRNSDRFGCAKSWNLGVKDAFDRGFDYVFIVNNDVIFHPEAIDRLVERFEASKSIRMLKVDPKNINIALAVGEAMEITAEGQMITEYDTLAMITCMDIHGECSNPADIFNKFSESYKEVAEAEHPCFSAFMINKTCYEKVGEFDEGFTPAYFEDNDYHYRINLAGMKAIVLPTSLFYHYGSRTQVEAFNHREQMMAHESFRLNQFYYKAKWGGLPGGENFTFPFEHIGWDWTWVKQNNK